MALYPGRPHQYGDPVVVERGSGLLHSFDLSREEEEGEDPCMETEVGGETELS